MDLLEIRKQEINNPLVEKIGATPMPFEMFYNEVAKDKYKARYPEYNFFRDNEDYYAKQQSGLDKIVNAGLTFGTLAKNTFLNHFASYAKGADSFLSGNINDSWNTAFGEKIAKDVIGVQTRFPIYETAEQQKLRDKEAGSTIGNIGLGFKQYVPLISGRAGNAWANLFGQLGFTAGTIGAVGAESLALGFATGGSAGAVKAITNINKYKDIKTFYEIVKQARNMYNIEKTASKVNMVGKIVNSAPVTLARMYVASSGESSIEASTNAIEFIEEQKRKYREINGYDAPPDVIREIEKQSLKVGDATFAWNIPVLMVSNAVTIGNLFKPKNFSSIAYVPKTVTEGIKKTTPFLRSSDVMTNYIAKYPKLQKGLEFGKKVSVVGKENFTEGFEEVLQGVGAATAQHRYDIFADRQGKEQGSFLLAAMGELSESLKTREIWDEFSAGFMTGFAIKGFNYGFNKLSGKSKLEAEAIKKGIDEITIANSKYVDAVFQNKAAQAVNESLSENDIKKAKDVQDEAKLNLYITLNKYGVAKEYFESLGDTVKDMMDTEQVQEMLKDKTVEDVINSLKEEYQQHENRVEKMRKNVGNPYQEGTKEYEAWDTGIQIATDLERKTENAYSRMKNIQTELQQKFGIEGQVIEAILNPEKNQQVIDTINDRIARHKERLTVPDLSESEKIQINKDIAEEENKLQVYNKVKENYFDAKGNLKSPLSSGMATDVLRAMFGENFSPEAKQMLQDVIELEKDGQTYLSLYNLLSDREKFAVYGETFTKRYLSLTDNVLKRIDRAVEDVAELEDNEEVIYNANDAISQIDKTGTPMGEVTSVLSNIENITKTPQGTLVYNNVEYPNKTALLNKLIEEAGVTKDQLDTTTENEETVGDVLQGRINDHVNSITTTEAEQQAEDNVINASSYIDKGEPTSQTESEQELFSFTQNKSGKTMLHYFDLVVSKIFSNRNPLDSLFQRLSTIGDTETKTKLKNAAKEIGDKVNVTMISLMVYGETDPVFKNSKGENVSIADINKKSENLRIVYDGIRYFFLTKKNAQNSDGKTIKVEQVIEDETGLQIIATNNTAIVRDHNGVVIVSPFRQDKSISKVSDKILHQTRKGDVVNLVVADDEWNRNILSSLPKASEAEKKKAVDKLSIAIQRNGVTVGILRATDFLFEDNTTDIDEFRQRLLGDVTTLKVNTVIGHTTVEAVTALRNKNIDKGGRVVYTKVADYKPIDETDNNSPFEMSFYYVLDDQTIIDEKGDRVNPEIFDRAGFKVGGIYMTLNNKSNGKNHTVQLYKGETEANVAPKFTEEEFKSGEFKNLATTNLSQNTPISSKRLIINMHPSAIEKGLGEEKEGNVREENKSRYDEIVGEEVEEDLQAKLLIEANKVSSGVVPLTVSNFFNAVVEYAASLGMKGEKLITQLKKDLEEVLGENIDEDIDDVKEEILQRVKDFKPTPKKQLKNVVITDRNGVEKILLNTYLNENNEIVDENGDSYDLADITNIQEYTPTLEETTPQPEPEKQLTFEEALAKGEEILWISTNGQKGEVYDLGNDIIEIKHKSSVGIIYKATSKVDGRVGYGAFTVNGKQETLKYEKGRVAIGDNTPETISAEEILDYNTNEDRLSSYMEMIKNQLYLYGMSADDIQTMLIKLQQAYLKAKLENKSTTLENLIGEKVLDDVETATLLTAISPIFRNVLWQYITNSETIFNIDGNKRWESLKAQLQPIIANFDETKNPNDFKGQAENARDNYLDEEVESFTKAIYNALKISVKNLNIKLFTLEEFDEFLTKIKEALTIQNAQEGIKNLVTALQQSGAKIKYNGQMGVYRVARKTLGNSPVKAFDNQSIMTDVMMSNVDGETYVRNEADGFYVKMKPKKLKAQENILKIQKELVNLLGISFSVDYLQSYLELNGDFSGLRQRALLEKTKREVPNAENIIEVESVEKKEKKYIVVKQNADVLEYNGKLYTPMMQNRKGETIYQEQGVSLTNKEIEKIMRENDIPRSVPKKVSSLGNKVSSLRNINKKKNEITCE